MQDYDPTRDLDDAPGIVIERGGVDFGETDPDRFQLWLTVPGAMTIDGHVTFTVWSAMEDFDTNLGGSVEASLFYESGASWVEISFDRVTRGDWDVDDTGGWIETTFDFGHVNLNLQNNRDFGVQIIVPNTSGGNMWFAYDTVDYPARIEVGTEPVDPPLLMSTVGDVSAGGQWGLDTWQSGDIVGFGQPDVYLAQPPTYPPNGYFTLQSDMDKFSGGVNIDAIHRVTTGMRLGASQFELKAGDLLLSTTAATTLFSAATPTDPDFTNNLSVTAADVFVFRPEVPGDYSEGTFSLLLEDPSGLGQDVRGITLVEKDTAVGDATLNAGDFLFLHAGGGNKNVWLFETNDVGQGSTSGNVVELLRGDDPNVGITDELWGIELIEQRTNIGGPTLEEGTLLLTTANALTVGRNALPVEAWDIFTLTVDKTTLVAGVGNGDVTAAHLFEGGYSNFDSTQERIDGLTLTVPSNTAPVLGAAGPALPDITEDEINNSGESVATILGGSAFDADGDPVGIAITATSEGTGTGYWEYSVDGGTNWFSVGDVSDAAALVLRSSDRIRFVPGSNDADTAAFAYRAWDGSELTAPGLKADLSYSAGTTAVSESVNIATISVLAVNDAPSISSATLPDVQEDVVAPAGDTVLNLFGGSFSDPDAGAFLAGIAIVGNTANPLTEGVWEYTTGTSWYAVGTVDETNALTMRANASLRFVPAPDYNGSPPPLTVRALDDTYESVYGIHYSTTAFGESRKFIDATINGGSTPISGTTATLDTSVTAVNDDPFLAGTLPASLTVVEATPTDIDLSMLDPDDVDAGAGTLTMTIDSGAGATLTAVDAWGVTVSGSGGSNLVLQGTLADLNAFLDDTTTIQYQGLAGASGPGIDTLEIWLNDNGNTGAGGGVPISLGTVDIDATPLNTPPDIDSDGGGPVANLAVAENTTAVTTVTATDPDPDVLDFQITGGADMGLFSIDSVSGALSFDTAPDFETPGDADANNVYEVEVTVDDGNGGFDVQTINVTVTDVANTLVVDTTSDAAPDGDVSSIEALNADKGADGAISLREAILAANNTPDLSGRDVITFNISGGGPQTIVLGSALPDIEFGSVLIDGWSQPGFANTPLIEIDGGGTTATSGLTLGAGSDGSIIRGLIINGFDNDDIVVGSGGNTIAGNWIGLDSTGTVGAGNLGYGISVMPGAGGNVIGGTTDIERNVIADNAGGILLNGSDLNIVTGNFIGTSWDGTNSLGNLGHGIQIVDGASNTIGGTTSNERNIISNNDGDGVHIAGGGSTGNTLYGNFIGLDVFGTTGMGNGGDGVRIVDASGNFVGGAGAGEGNVIADSSFAGVVIHGSFATGNEVLGNMIGTNLGGVADYGNDGDGVVISGGASNNTIGGSVPGARNVIVGSGFSGVYITGSSGNFVRGNFVGIDVTGSGTIANQSDGIELDNASGNVIGGTTAEERNIIGGNLGVGVSISSGSNNQVLGNYIGTDASGGAARPNQLGGVSLTNASSNFIGGGAAGEGNLISGNAGDGITVNSGGDNVIRGNLIGTNVSGTGPLANAGHGIGIYGGAFGTMVGGFGPGDRNVISGNAAKGVFILGSSSNTLQGNLIGVDIGGSTPLGNFDDGIHIENAANNMIGGGAAGAGNVIGGNGDDGIFINGAGSTGNMVRGNFIGTDTFGNINLGNLSGVVVSGGASSNVIGGTSPNDGNTISFNAMRGVEITGGTDNAVLGNVMKNNAELGIDIGPIGLTPNDPDDADPGPNELQNFPVLVKAGTNGVDSVTITGTLNSTANTDFVIEFFASTSGDPSGHGEAHRFIGAVSVTTDISGNASFSQNFAEMVSLGEHITATATVDLGGGFFGSTSEFAQNVLASPPNTPPVAQDDDFSIPEDTTLFGNVLDDNGSGPDFDPDPDTLNVTLVSGPSNALSFTLNSDGSFDYTPTADYNGPDSFTYKVNDGVADSNVATVSIDVTPVDDDPPALVVNGGSVVAEGGGDVILPSELEYSDTEQPATAITYTVTAGPVFGQLELTTDPGVPIGSFTQDDIDNNRLIYVHDGSETLSDGFDFDVGDGQGNVLTGQSFSFSVIPQNDPPVITSDLGGATAAVNVAENTTQVTTVTATDADLDIPTFSISGGNDQGLFSIDSVTGELTFVTAPDFENPADVGLDNVYEVEVTAADGNGGLDVQMIFVTVTDVSNVLVVDTTADTVDGDWSSIEALNADKGTDGVISLREAILAANITTNSGGPDVISFDITGAGPHMISLLSELPDITDAVIIDGTTDPDFVDKPIIELNGSGAGSASGLTLTGSSAGSTVRGLIINSFTGDGIRLDTSNNTIAGNWIGLASDGDMIKANAGDGVYVSSGSSGNVIGGSVDADRNVISGNADGIHIDGDGNTIIGNFIGTDTTGMLARPNAGVGVYIDFASSNVIGSASAGERNVISGNASDGIAIRGNTATNNQVLGNFIGVDASGNGKLANGDDGIEIDNSGGNVIGAAGAGNVISGNADNGIDISGGDSIGNVVQGNLIGTDATGTIALGNTFEGVYLHVDASANLIGGTSPGERNVISGNELDGIYIRNSDGNTVSGNYIGVDISGGVALGNWDDGIEIEHSSNNIVGGPAPGAGNVISGNLEDGVDIWGTGSDGNRVQGNFIGTDESGMNPIGNVDHGVHISGGTINNLVGGTNPGERNVIAANRDGIYISGASWNVVEGNYIGVDVTGASPLGNLGNLDDGVQIDNGTNNRIGGSAPNAGNVISDNIDDGVHLSGGSSDNIVQGNHIGMDAAGTSAIGNHDDGIYISGGSSGNIIGGALPDEGNVISGNADEGIAIDSSNANTVQGNYIGVDVNGGGFFGNAEIGIHILNSADNLIGGVGAGNVISNSGQEALDIGGALATGNVVQGNLIGTDQSGTVALGNVDGILIHTDASGNLIGGTSAGEGNLIAFSGGAGVAVTSTFENAVLTNSIHSNAGLGIDLGDDGLSGNDFGTGDGDTGPNSLQNFPVLSSASTNGVDTVVVVGSIDSTPGTTFRIEFFAAGTPDPSSHGEGEVYLGFTTVTTGVSGLASFSAPVSALLNPGEQVTATATVDLGGGNYGATSEFSLNVTAILNSAPVAQDDAFVTNEDTLLVGNVLADNGFGSDSDPDGNSLTASLVGGPSNALSFTFNPDGTFDYTPNPDFSGADSFTYLVSDGFVDSNVATVTISVTAQNDPPVNTVPAPQSTNQDTPLIFSTGNGNLISVGDVDAAGADLKVTLTAASGTLTLAGTTGLVFSGGADGTASMTFTGNLVDINAALDGLRFDPTPGFAGAASVQIITDDQGSSGAGGPLTDTDSVDIAVVDVTPPAAPTVSAQLTNSSQPIITGTYDSADAAGGLTVTVDGTTYTFGTDAALTTAGDNWSLDLIVSGQTLADGAYDVQAIATDAASNAAGDATVNEIVVDTTAPASPTVDNLTTNNDQPTITGTYDAAGTSGVLTVTVDGMTYTLGTDPALTALGNDWTLDLAVSAQILADGTYDVVVMSTDAAGNTSSDATAGEVIIDTTAPAVVVNTGSTVAEGGTDPIPVTELAYADSEQPPGAVTYT
ncbi:MAG: cadherin-like domain-containing protein, partial [Gammaproteobacteria bacterium]|nr:cadherin-like domain-containing protein [Gammaproteobacteria bacterium]